MTSYPTPLHPQISTHLTQCSGTKIQHTSFSEAIFGLGIFLKVL